MASAFFDIAIGSVLTVISLVIALAVYPTLADKTAEAQASTNVTGASDTMLGLLPLIVAAAILAGGIVFLVRGFQKVGGG